METEQTFHAGQDASYVNCAKCGFPNEFGWELCARCGRHLFVVCSCGARNVRTRTTCGQCGELLRSRHEHFDGWCVNSFIFRPLEPRTSKTSGGRPNDLAAALLMLGLVVTLPVGVSVCSMLQEQFQAEQDSINTVRQAEQDAALRRGQAILEERQRQQQNDPWRKWIDGR
jgi:hypothetical protein